ncbi:MAG: SDR family oxidoreductase [candidate division Zixibacteria bacterium]|nr:SDR family oxidoreductase [candidate division Zixibacteria bacterium]
MRIAVTGAAGLLGQALIATLRGRGHVVIAGVHHARPSWPENVTLLPLDLTEPRSTTQFATSAQADWIIHAAAMTDVDRCESEPASAERVNRDATRDLISAISQTQTRMVYLSTDYVFDGRDGPYSEDDPPNPINVYGRTKYEGECAVREAPDGHVIVRSASFLGIGGPRRPTFIERMLQTMRDHPPLRAAHDQRGNITPVDFLALAIAELLERGLGGVWHVAGREIVSRYDLAVAVARMFDLLSTAVARCNYAELGRPAKRPLNGGLIVTKAETTVSARCDGLALSLRKWKDGLADRIV